MLANLFAIIEWEITTLALEVFFPSFWSVTYRSFTVLSIPETFMPVILGNFIAFRLVCRLLEALPVVTILKIKVLT